MAVIFYSQIHSVIRDFFFFSERMNCGLTLGHLVVMKEYMQRPREKRERSINPARAKVRLQQHWRSVAIYYPDDVVLSPGA